jgi:hypothetical protein
MNFDGEYLTNGGRPPNSDFRFVFYDPELTRNDGLNMFKEHFWKIQKMVLLNGHSTVWAIGSSGSLPSDIFSQHGSKTLCLPNLSEIWDISLQPHSSFLSTGLGFSFWISKVLGSPNGKFSKFKNLHGLWEFLELFQFCCWFLSVLEIDNQQPRIFMHTSCSKNNCDAFFQFFYRPIKESVQIKILPSQFNRKWKTV